MSKILIGISGKKGAGKDELFSMISYHIGQIRKKKGDSFQEYMECYRGASTKGYYHGLVNLKFADALKDMVCLLLGCTREQLEDREYKEKELPKEWSQWGIEVQDKGLFMGTKWPTQHEAEEVLDHYKSDLAFKTKMVLKEFSMTPRLMLQLLGTEGVRNTIHENAWVNAGISAWIKVDAPAGFTDVRFPNEADAILDNGGCLFRIERKGLDTSDQHASETALDKYPHFDLTIHNNGTLESLFNAAYSLAQFAIEAKTA